MAAAEALLLGWSRARIDGDAREVRSSSASSRRSTTSWFERPSQDDRITTQIAVGDYYDGAREALLAHATQIDPDVAVLVRPAPRRGSPAVHPCEDYMLAQSLVATEIPEDDLFAGIRGSVDA